MLYNQMRKRRIRYVTQGNGERGERGLLLLERVARTMTGLASAVNALAGDKWVFCALSGIENTLTHTCIYIY